MLVSSAPSVSVPIRQAANVPAGTDPAPQEETFSWNPQDRRVMEPTSKVIPGVMQGKVGPEVEQARLNEALDKVDGKYVYAHDDPRQNTAVAFSAVANTIKVFREAYGDFKWSFNAPKLGVNANAGQMLNAYYSRNSQAVNFFRYPDPIAGQDVHSGSSGEIVSHETGHAILDGIRPGFLGSWSPDPGAFHESFGDMMGLHTSLMDDRVLNRVVVQTNGDLSIPNVAAYTAEELAVGINDSKGKNQTGGDYLRDANNKFVWADPATLPDKGGPNELGREVHSFSRLWTGAHFDVLKGLVKEKMAAGKDAKSAISESNTELLGMLANMVKESPKGDFSYKDMAVAFVQSDQKYAQGKHVELIKKCFTDRRILPEGVEIPPASQGPRGTDDLEPANVTVRLDDSCGMFCGAEVKVPVDAEQALFKSAEIQAKTQRDLKQLIDDGKIRYNDPGYQIKPGDCFNPQGSPYIGSVVWTDGKMQIERLPVVD